MSKKDECISCTLPDVQSTEENRGKSIDRVGVGKFKLPILFEDQLRIAEISSYVSLPHNIRGANFSRFIITATKHFSNKELSSSTISKMLEDLRVIMKSADAYVEIEFDYLIEKESPVTKIKGGYQGYKIGFIGLLRKDQSVIIRRFNIVGSTTCPCSKSMSLLPQLLKEEDISVEKNPLLNQVGKGAHNQRVNIRVDISLNNGFSLDTKDFIFHIENCASAEVYPILKRPDEKWLTEKAYSRPRFVEDVVREVAVYLDKADLSKKNIITGYSIRCIADESIHPHNAIAYLSKNWKLH